MKILIIGGVAGGASAATRARRVNPKAEITIFEKGPNISFANCGLPYHLGGEIEKREKLLVASSELFKTRFGIEVKVLTEVTEIDRQKKEVVAKNLLTGLFENISYDKLIISTGSALRSIASLPQGLKNVFSLWSLNDLDKALAYIKSSGSKNAVTIGAGFVGLEIAEQLKRLNMKVSLVEKAPQVLGPLDPEMASFIADELKMRSIDLYLNSEVVSHESNDGLLTEVTLNTGSKISTDILFWGIGVIPESKLAANAGLALGPTGGICVNEHQQTSDLDIYAVGDASEYFYAPLNKKILVPLAGPANRSGRIAGEHAAVGTTQITQKVQGTAIVRIFSKTAAITGLSERACINQNIPYVTSFISSLNHASYFPGAKELVIKTLFSPFDGKILGSQIVGEEGVDKRIDVLATILHFNGTAKDLAGLDLAYAPPFGSAKDPVHIAAFTILNHLDKRPMLMSPNADLRTYQVVDVRTQQEINSLPLDSAISIPLDDPNVDIRERLSSLDTNKSTVVVCHSGKRAHIVASMLTSMGFKSVFNLTGGMMIRNRFTKSFI